MIKLNFGIKRYKPYGCAAWERTKVFYIDKNTMNDVITAFSTMEYNSVKNISLLLGLSEHTVHQILNARYNMRHNAK